MPRRASLPGADLLFGGVSDGRTRDDVRRQEPALSPPEPPEMTMPAASEAGAAEGETPQPAPPADPAGKAVRPRHDEKITVYCTDSDLNRLEAARLRLRADHRLPSDRGRIVRAAIAEILDDFDARGADSALVRRLSNQ